MSDPFLMSAYLPLSDSCSICKQEGARKHRLWGHTLCEDCFRKSVKGYGA